MPAPLYDKSRLRADFDKAARHYDDRAMLQHRVAQSLYAKASKILPKNISVLDVGCGTGFLHQLADAEKRWPLTQLDISYQMCLQAQQKHGAHHVINGDAENLPFADNSFDGALSSLTVQWLDSIEYFCEELFRVLSANSHMIFSSFGPATLHELKAAFDHTDNASKRVNSFTSLEHLRKAVQDAGFTGVYSASEIITEHYPNSTAVMHATRSIGGGNKFRQRSQAMSGKGRFSKMEDYYRTHYATPDGQLPATWEILYIAAYKPE